MREYLFRGKRKGDKEWQFGSLHIIEWDKPAKAKGDYIDYRILGRHNECSYVDPETVGQYTGLKDNNGVKIFEGDIVEVVTQDTNEVRRTAIGIGLCKETGDDVAVVGVYCDYFEKPYVFPVVMGAHVEVIGNIHDNPELLKEGGNDAPY